MNTPNSTIGDRIKEIRGSESLTNFSSAISCNINTLRSYERGLANPNFEFIQLICGVKNISTDWLVFGRGPMRPGEAAQPAETPTQSTVTITETATCTRCAKLEAELEEERRERRELNVENRKLWQENAELREQCATLTERQKHCCPEPNFSKDPAIPFSDARV